jgi:outer membrane protein assembly factor BamB
MKRIFALLMSLALAGVAVADNWPRFRGPNADGVAEDNPALPDRWDRKDNVDWVVDVSGQGWSSPIV